MASAVLDKVGVDILSKAKDLQLRATGQTIAFAGFIKVYKEDVDDVKNDDAQVIFTHKYIHYLPKNAIIGQKLSSFGVFAA